MIGLPDVLRLELELPIDFHRDTMRQLGHANSRAGMLAGLWPKQLVEEIGCAVDHLGHAIEPRRYVDHAEQPHDSRR